MSRRGATHVEEILNMHPIGNDPRFPNMRVYTEPARPNDPSFMPQSWELNSTNSKIWGNAVVYS